LACSASFHLLRRSIAWRQRNEEPLTALHRRQARKNYLALLIYAAALPLAWVNIPAAMGLIALPALMYFLPDRHVEKLQPREN